MAEKELRHSAGSRRRPMVGAESTFGTFRTSRFSREGSAVEGKADHRRCRRIVSVWHVTDLVLSLVVKRRPTISSCVVSAIDFAIDDEIIRHGGSPDIDGIFHRVILSLPVHSLRYVVEVACIFRPAAPRIADVVKVI